MDFGLARLGGSEMTRAGMVMGTPHYMSPEQVRGERAEARSDVFALGCVFYELLTYQKPFDADSMHSVLFKVMQEDPRPLRETTPMWPGSTRSTSGRPAAVIVTTVLRSSTRERERLMRPLVSSRPAW